MRTRSLPNDRLMPFRADETCGVLIEAAFAVPLLVTLMTGILAFGSWFMTAHGLQQAANNAARAAVAGLNTAERRAIVDDSIAVSGPTMPSAGGPAILVSTQEAGGYYTVTLRYDIAATPLFSTLPLPLPSNQIVRSAVVRIPGA